MKKPAELVELVEALDAIYNPDEESVDMIDSGVAVVRFENGQEIRLDTFECERLFQSVEAAAKFSKVFGVDAGTLSLELQGVRIPSDVLDYLTEVFSSCEEV